MRIARAALSGVLGILCAFNLSGCGGGGYGGGSNAPPPPASVTVSVSPTSITVGQSATVTWSSNSGTNCTASGAWSGAQSASGSATVTPTAAGALTYTLSCTGNAYSSGNDSATLTVSAASAFSLTSLVGDVAGGTALNTDANLVNPWGLSIPAGPFFAWVANNHSDTSTLYDGNGKPQPHAGPLVVSFPSGGGSFDPTGIVFNGTAADFTVTAAGKSGGASFIFDGEGGAIAGWSATVDLSNAIVMYTDAGGAIYKGLAIAKNGGAAFIYATDFHNNKVDVFDAHFVKQTPSSSAFTFADATVPAGYAPFGIQALDTGASGATQIYVTYAKQDPAGGPDNVDGAGLGYVDVYDTNGQFVKQLVAAGALNAPWGIALAPADFGTLSSALLVGNFGDGKVNGYDVATGAYIGTLSDSTGAAIATPGLWGIAFGNDANNQPHNTLFFAAGTNNEANGSYGRIDLGATPPVLNAPPVVTLTVPAGSLKGTVTLSAAAVDPISIAKVEFLAGATVIGTAATAPYSITWDTTTVADGPVNLTAKATDVDGNVGTSAVSAVTVANAVVAQVTLTQLQTQIFTPRCAICHDGNGAGLPNVQNLTAGNTFANIVNVVSIEVPTLKRILPNDPANSYLVQKIVGGAGLTQMPKGCSGTGSNACLDQATIDLVKTWVNQGALNN